MIEARWCIGSIWRALAVAGIVLLCLGAFQPTQAEGADGKGGRFFIVFRNDDLNAFSDPEHERKILEMFAKYQIPQSIGVIPFVVKKPEDSASQKAESINANREITVLLNEYHARGLVDIAQHGYRHQASSVKSNPGAFSEFRGAARDAQRKMIVKGKDLLEKTFGQAVCAFIPPWNTFDVNTLSVLKENGYRLLSGRSTYLIIEKLYPDVIDLGKVIDAGDTSDALLQLKNRRDTWGKAEAAVAVVWYHSGWIDTPKKLRAFEELLMEVSDKDYETTTFSRICADLAP